MARLRYKYCFKCSEQKDVLYRCRYDEIKDWVFLCGECQKKLRFYLKTLTNTVALGIVKRSKLLYCFTAVY